MQAPHYGKPTICSECGHQTEKPKTRMRDRAVCLKCQYKKQQAWRDKHKKQAKRREEDKQRELDTMRELYR